MKRQRPFVFFIHALLIFVIPTQLLYPHSQEPIPSYLPMDPIVAKVLGRTDSLLYYNDVITLIEQIETGALHKRCSFDELKKICHFLAVLAREGQLSKDFQAKYNLEQDIQELLNDLNEPFPCAFSYDQGGDYSFIPALNVYNEETEVIFCQSWVSKQWKKAKHFVKKHKQAVVIGTIAVVATVAIIATVGTAAAATGAVAAASAANASRSSSKRGNAEHESGAPKKKKGNKWGQQPPEEEQSAPAQEPAPLIAEPIEAPYLQEVLRDQLTSVKDQMIEDNLMPALANDPSWADTARTYGAICAHQVLDGVGQAVGDAPKLFQEVREIGSRFFPETLQDSQDNPLVSANPIETFQQRIATGHQTIDQIFSTNQAGCYAPEVKKAKDRFAVGILPPPGMLGGISINANKLAELAEAGNVLDRGNFIRVGRGLMKHGYRKGSLFPKPMGNPEQINKQGQAVLNEILNDPNKKVYQLSDGSLKIYASDGKGAFFRSDGNFRGFIEQQYE